MDYHRDHPDQYFRRLQSYSKEQPRVPRGARPRPQSKPRTCSESPPKPRLNIDSRTNSYEDTVDRSEVTPPRRTKRRSRRDSNAGYHEDVTDRSEPRRPREQKRRPRPDAPVRGDLESIDGSEVARPKRSRRRSKLDDLEPDEQDTVDGSEITAPKRSKRHTRPDSLASLHPESPAPTPAPALARPDSYASTRPSSYFNSRPQSYADTDGLTYDFNEKSDYFDDGPRKINADLLRRYDDLQDPKQESWWTRKRKIWIGVAVGIIALIIIIVGAVVGSKKSFKYTPSYVQVNNTIAFQKGGATHQSINVTDDGVGAGQDVYQYYQGTAAQFPDASKWISFQNMWNANLPNIQKSCSWLGYPPDNTAEDNAYLFNAIQDRANASLVDHRFVLAIVLQESHGCVRVGGTTSSGGVTNPGLMQSHNGDSYVKSDPWLSILLMIQDGVQGTYHGDGLVQLLNIYGDPYKAARGYNSGYIPKSGDLSEAAGATACYVSDVANRLTGWVNADSTCPDAE